MARIQDRIDVVIANVRADRDRVRDQQTVVESRLNDRLVALQSLRGRVASGRLTEDDVVALLDEGVLKGL